MALRREQIASTFSQRGATCALIATHNVRRDLDPEEILRVFKSWGWDERQGVSTMGIAAALDELGLVFEKRVFIGAKKMTLAQFCRRYRRGVFLVCVRGHALTVVNGRVIDNIDRTNRRRVMTAMHILNPKPIEDT